jgi:hypothetical protein
MSRTKIKDLDTFKKQMVVRDHALEMQKDSCPGCKRKLRLYEGEFEGITFRGVKCPKGCDLSKFWR